MPDSKTKIRPKIRLYVDMAYEAGEILHLEPAQSHFLAHVMRAREGDMIAVFNGRDGQWNASVASIAKKQVTLRLDRQTQIQKYCPDVWLAFAPIKNKTELVVEKAVELGVSRILPVFTRYAVVRSINHDKLSAHAVEAAEQCERHDVPPISEYKDLAALLGAWPKDRVLLYADESGQGRDLKSVLADLSVPVPCAVLIGPEGGFAPDEQHMLRNAAFVKPFGMGPRILRADTAAVAALACVQAWLGDWRQPPSFQPLAETTSL